MNYGKSSTGFIPKPFEVVQGEMFDALTTHFGPIDRDPDGPFGSIVDVASVPHTEMWQELQGLSVAIDAVSAEGAQLDSIAALNGISRRPPTNTIVDCVARGLPNTVIPAGSQVTREGDSTAFVSPDAITISADNCIIGEIAVGASVVAGTAYDVVITPSDRATVTISVLTNYPTPAEQAEDFATQISTHSVEARLSSVTVGGSVEEPIIYITSYSPYAVFTLSVTTDPSIMAVNYVHSPIQFIAQGAGPIIISPNTLTSIGTPVSGWTSNTNLISGQAGAYSEEDENLRRRRTVALQTGGASTPNSIQTRLRQLVRGVSLAQIFENPTDNVDIYGRNAHTIHPVIEGGVHADILQVLADNHPAGIGFHGQSTGQVLDSAGNAVHVAYDRVGTLFGHVRVTISDRNDEEAFPSNGVEQVRQNLFLYLSVRAELGLDIVSQQLTGTVFQVEGFKQAKIEVACTGQLGTNPDNGPSGSYINQVLSGYNSGWEEVYVKVAPWNRVEWRDSFPRITVVNEL